MPRLWAQSSTQDGGVDNFPAAAITAASIEFCTTGVGDGGSDLVSSNRASWRGDGNSRSSRTARNASDSTRTPRAFWFDPRFAIGIILVVLSVVGVVAVVSAADSSVTVYSARSSLSPGERIRTSDLDGQSVRLGSLGGKYLLDGDIPNAGVVVTRAVSAGELVPASAVGAVVGASVASIVVTVSGELARSVGDGSVVDLWYARETEERIFGPPSVLVASATVVRVIAKDGMIADRAEQSVELLVPRSKIAVVLEAIANADTLSLVPSSIPAKG